MTAFCALLFASLAGATVVNVENYGYPITDRFEATVVGTPTAFEAELPKSIPFKERRITIFPDRVTPDVFFYGSELLYSVALQNARCSVDISHRRNRCRTQRQQEPQYGQGVLPGRLSCRLHFLANL